MTDAAVNLWGRRVGAVSWDADRAAGVFQYEPAFLGAGIELSPFEVRVREAPYAFPELSRSSFKGLPGLLADSLPDRFGNRLIDAWLAANGIRAAAFNPVDRLCYIGSRGMGALEFEPAIFGGGRGGEIELAQMVGLVNDVLTQRLALSGRLGGADDRAALEDILSVGTSAGGARAKALLAWNPSTGEFRSGQVDTAAGFEHWILKFDGVAEGPDRGLADPRGYGMIEYAYHLMARDAGVEMAKCRLHHEGGRSHFMTRRFDRDENGRKTHMQSLGALRHFDYRDPGAHAYEQAMETIRALGLGAPALKQQFRRTVFNIAARNQDDHVKNISFLMDRSGAWRLSPAYDVIYSFNPSGDWTQKHQMSVGGKRDDFQYDDLMRFANASGLKRSWARRAISEILAAVGNWPRYAREAQVPQRDIRRIQKTHRVESMASGHKKNPRVRGWPDRSSQGLYGELGLTGYRARNESMLTASVAKAPRRSAVSFAVRGASLSFMSIPFTSST